MSVLTFTEYIPSKPSASGKIMPPKAKASDGNTYALNKDIVDLIQFSLGTPLEVVTDTKPSKDGKYQNHSVLSARHQTPAAAHQFIAAPPLHPASPSLVPPTAPVSAPTPTPPVQERVAVTSPPSSWHPAPDRERLIVRQSSLKAAVELLSGSVLTDESLGRVFKLADTFVDWVYSGVNASSDTATPTSPAQSALNEVRQKSADLRSAYLPNQLVCPNCGRSEYIKEGSQGFFCKRTEGALGCGYPPRGERLDALITYAEWQQRAPGVPWK